VCRANPRAQGAVAGVRAAFRKRLRTVRRAVQQVQRLRRHLGAPPDLPPPVAAKAERQRARSRTLLTTTPLPLRQAERIRDVLRPPPDGQEQAQEEQAQEEQAPSAERVRRRVVTQRDRFIPRVRQVMAQAHRRVLAGQQVPAAEKIVSLFAPHTRIIPRQKGGAALEFGRQVMGDAVDGQLITRAHVLADGESEHQQALPAVRHHQALFGHPPGLVTGDRGLHAAGVEEQARALGVRQVAIPWTGRGSTTRRARERDRTWQRH